MLLPLSFIFALVLVSQGVVQTFAGSATAHLLTPTSADGKAVTDQLLALGPAASQIAIKQLGTNGGGFFNVNSAHPFENPTAALELPSADLDFAHPRGPLLHVRRAGQGPTAGLHGATPPCSSSSCRC